MRIKQLGATARHPQALRPRQKGKYTEWDQTRVHLTVTDWHLPGTSAYLLMQKKFMKCIEVKLAAVYTTPAVHDLSAVDDVAAIQDLPFKVNEKDLRLCHCLYVCMHRQAGLQ